MRILNFLWNGLLISCFDLCFACLIAYYCLLLLERSLWSTDSDDSSHDSPSIQIDPLFSISFLSFFSFWYDKNDNDSDNSDGNWLAWLHASIQWERSRCDWILPREDGTKWLVNKHANCGRMKDGTEIAKWKKGINKCLLFQRNCQLNKHWPFSRTDILSDSGVIDSGSLTLPMLINAYKKEELMNMFVLFLDNILSYPLVEGERDIECSTFIRFPFQVRNLT